MARVSDALPLGPLFSCGDRFPLIRYHNTGEYDQIRLGKLRLALRQIGRLDLLRGPDGRALAPRKIIELHAVKISAAEYERLTAYRAP